MKCPDGHWLAGAIFALALLVATFPTWRLLFRGDQPTFEELVGRVCSTPEASEPGMPSQCHVGKPADDFVLIGLSCKRIT